MSDIYSADDGWAGLYGVTFIGGWYCVSYGLAKFGILTSDNYGKVAQWISVIGATIMSVGSDGGAKFGSVSDFMGRIGIFGLVYFFLGIVLTFGMAIGVEKAKK